MSIEWCSVLRPGVTQDGLGDCEDYRKKPRLTKGGGIM